MSIFRKQKLEVRKKIIENRFLKFYQFLKSAFQNSNKSNYILKKLGVPCDKLGAFAVKT